MTKRILLASALLTLAFLTTGAGPATKPATPAPKGEEFAIDEYDFDWFLIKAEDFSLTINKTQDATTVRLRNHFDHVTMEPKDAEAVGEALKKTDEEYKALKGSPNDKSDDVVAGKFTVTFYWTVKNGFYISIRPNERFAMSHVMLERKQANDAAKFLVTATKMAAYLDGKVKP